jgi:hypothetical protein
MNIGAVLSRIKQLDFDTLECLDGEITLLKDGMCYGKNEFQSNSITKHFILVLESENLPNCSIELK